jgi:hypothetical protein
VRAPARPVTSANDAQEYTSPTRTTPRSRLATLSLVEALREVAGQLASATRSPSRRSADLRARVGSWSTSSVAVRVRARMIGLRLQQHESAGGAQPSSNMLSLAPGSGPTWASKTPRRWRIRSHELQDHNNAARQQKLPKPLLLGIPSWPVGILTPTESHLRPSRLPHSCPTREVAVALRPPGMSGNSVFCVSRPARGRL